MDSLPDDVACHVALFLKAPELLSWLCTETRCYRLGQRASLWRSLCARDTDSDSSNHQLPVGRRIHTDRVEDPSVTVSLAAIKRRFLVNAHASELSSVRWLHMQSSFWMPRTQPPGREGHLMCVLGSESSGQRRILMTGGFTDDPSLYTLSLPPSRHRSWQQHRPIGGEPSFVYGASLTAIGERSAVRFGGFAAGGYSAETNQVFVLTWEANPQNGRDHFSWQLKTPSGTPPRPRAYHSATLLQDRYLLVVGGMTTRGSILDEAILDLHTWTWLEDSVSLSQNKPSGRHGHSVVLDTPRNRLVLFGGGSGSDLLRSGVDNTEVWELQMGTNCKSDLVSSLPWAWSNIHRNRPQQQQQQDQNGTQQRDADAHDPQDAEQQGQQRNSSDNVLSPSEGLMLGRCHISARVTRDSVILAFGSGHPSTNGILGYHLASDTFVRPQIQGQPPMPRFTAAAAFLEEEAWLVVNGGYCTQQGGTLGDTMVLDLVPVLKRQFAAMTTARDDDPNVQTHHLIGDNDLRHQGVRGGLGALLLRLSAATRQERETVADQILQGGGLDPHAALILSMVRDGAVVVGDDGDDDDDDWGEGEDA